jgi:hypothetical protein
MQIKCVALIAATISLILVTGASPTLKSAAAQTQPRDVEVTVSQTAVTIPQGSSGYASLLISIPSAMTSSQTVNLTSSQVPQGIDIRFSPDPITALPGQSVISTMTIAVNKTVPVGNYTVTITLAFESLNVTHSTPFMFQVISPRCVIATAAYGSELAAPVQALRVFRDSDVKRTYLGSRFMEAFDAWYYSWAPPVAIFESSHASLRASVRVALIPLLGTLYLSAALFGTLYPISSEGAILLSGIFASAMLGVVYLAPIAFTVSRLTRRKTSERTLAIVFISGIVLTLLGTALHGTVGILENLTSLIVVESLILSPVILNRAGDRAS